MKLLFTIATFLMFAVAVQAQLVKIVGQRINPSATAWNDSSEQLFTYNTQGQPYYQHTNFYNASAWRNGQKQINTYNTTGLPTKEEVFFWDDINMAWNTTASIITDYTYTTANLPETITKSYSGNSTTYKDSFVYNTGGQLIEKINAAGTYFYTYNTSGQLTQTLYKVMQGSSLVDFRRTNHSYNSAGQLTNETMEDWDANGNTWVPNDFRNLYTYNTDGTLDIALTEHIDNGNWTGFERYVYYYTTATATQKVVGDDDFLVYPNPSQGVFTLAANYSGTAPVITIYTLDGRLVWRETAQTTETVVNLSAFGKGIYLLHLQTDGGVHTQKLVVE